MSISNIIQANPRLKKLVHWAMVKPQQHRPRTWVKYIINPFRHKNGQGAIIRQRTKLDLFPSRNFEIGARSVIEEFSTINNGVGDIIIGENSFIGVANTIIGPVTIGDFVMTAQNVVISGMNHSYEDISIPPFIQKIQTKLIIVNDNVWIGANSVITAGVSIGKHSVIGAGSVVTKDVAPYTVVAGNPAKPIKHYDHERGAWLKV